MQRINQKNNKKIKIIINLIAILGLTSCTINEKYGDKPIIQGKVLILSDSDKNMCFRPDLTNITYLGNKKNGLKITNVSYHIESPNNLSPETVTNLKNIVVNSEGEEKLKAIKKLGTNRQLIWQADLVNEKQVLLGSELICIGKENEHFKQMMYGKFEEGKKYDISMGARIPDKGQSLYFTNTFIYSAD